MIKKTLKYKAICINPSVNMYSMMDLVLGETYDIFSSMYPDKVISGTLQYEYKEEMEVFKDGVYYTSFIHNGLTNRIEDMDKYFQRIRDRNLERLGI